MVLNGTKVVGITAEGFCVELGGRPDPPLERKGAKISKSAPQTSENAPFPEKSDFATQTGISTSRRAYVLRGNRCGTGASEGPAGADRGG